MRIVIDMQGAQTESRFRGIGRYSLSFALGVVRNRGDHEVFLLLNGMLSDSIESIRAAFRGLLPRKNIRVWYAQSPVKASDVENGARRQAAEFIRQACIDELQPDIVHVTSSIEGYIDDAVIGNPALSSSLVCSTLYDLIPLVRPKQYLDVNPVYKAHYLEKVEQFKHYDLLLSISDFARSEAIENLHLDDQKVVNVSTAADDFFSASKLGHQDLSAVKLKFGLADRFVLYSGGADDRKNLPRLIEAFSQARAEIAGLQLVFAGRMPDFYINEFRSLARSHGLEGADFVMTGYVSDQELAAIYSICTVYVFPSWHEGFGLPPLEAMKCGAPTIGADASSIPEVIGRKDALFDPFDTKSIADKIKEVVLSPELQEELSNYGTSRATQFSWDRTAKQAVAAFEALVHGDRNAASRDEIRSRETKEESALKRLIERLDESGSLRHPDIDLSVLARLVDSSVQSATAKRVLFVDISELCKHDGKSGIQRVVRSILLEWLSNPPDQFDVKPVYTKAGELYYRYATHFAKRFMGVITDDPEEDEVVSFCPGDVYLCLDLLMDVLPHKKAFLQSMRAHGVSINFVIYDLLILQMPHCFVDSLQHHYANWIDVVTEFDGALCISQAVADDLAIWMRANKPDRQDTFKIGAFHLGADIDQSVPSKGFPENPALRIESLAPGQHFLMVGTLEPRKGHKQVLDAFEFLWERGINANLIIVGKHGWLVDELAARILSHAELGKRLLWLDGISDEYLEYVYNNTQCLIAASEGEGFGLPLIEAAQYHLPIVARDLPVFREVAGEHAYYFHGASASGLAQELRTWLQLYSEGEHPTSERMPWLTWRESAGQLLTAVLEFEGKSVA